MKKLMSTILTLVLVLSLFAPASYAAKWDYDEIPTIVDRTNSEIDSLVEEARKEVEQINTSSNKAEKETNKIIDKLVKEIDKLADKTIKEAAKVSFGVICNYVEIEIGGQFVLIDPLIVISF